MESEATRNLSEVQRISNQLIKRVANHHARIALQTAIALFLFFLVTHHRVHADDLPVVDETLPEADKIVFARSFEKAAIEGDIEGLNALIDWDHIVDLITAGPDTIPLNQARKNFRSGFSKSQARGTKSGLAAQIIQVVKQGGSFKFLTSGEVNNESFAQFRLKVPNQGGANYHRYFLPRSKDGLVRAQDIYIFLAAERVSETARRVWLPLANEVSKNLVENNCRPFLTRWKNFLAMRSQGD